MEYFIVFDTETGDQKWQGNGSPGTFAALQLTAPLRAFPVSEAEWNAGAASLEGLRPQIWEAVKSVRDTMINGGAPTPAGVVDSDELSRSNISGAVLAALIAKTGGAPFAMNWTMLDNSVASLDADKVIAMGLAVMQHVNLAHDRARQLRAEIEAAETVGAVIQIDINAGWPS